MAVDCFDLDFSGLAAASDLAAEADFLLDVLALLLAGLTTSGTTTGSAT